MSAAAVPLPADPLCEFSFTLWPEGMELLWT
jgi:hypothetical protein